MSWRFNQLVVLWLVSAPALLSGCVAAAQKVEEPPATAQRQSSDELGKQAFVTFQSPLGFSTKVPAGWTRTESADGAHFTDKLRVIDIAVSDSSGPMAVATKLANEAKSLERSGRAIKIGTIKTAKLPAGTALIISYTAPSAQNSVFGRTLIGHDRYLFTGKNKIATLDISAPVETDTNELSLAISRSFAWQ